MILSSIFYTISYSLFAYKRKMSSTYTPLENYCVVVVSSFYSIFVTLIYVKGKISFENFKGNTITSLCFFNGQIIALKYGSKVSQQYNSIISQSKIGLVYILMLIFSKHRAKFTEVAGIILVSVVAVTVANETPKKCNNMVDYKLFATIMIAVGSWSNGLGVFLFSWFIRNNRTTSKPNYIIFSNTICLIFATLLIFYSVIFEGTQLCPKNFGSIAFFSFFIFLFSISGIFISFAFDSIPRLLLTVFLHLICDVIIDIINNSGVGWKLFAMRMLSSVGILVYQSETIIKYICNKSTSENAE